MVRAPASKPASRSCLRSTTIWSSTWGEILCGIVLGAFDRGLIASSPPFPVAAHDLVATHDLDTRGRGRPPGSCVPHGLPPRPHTWPAPAPWTPLVGVHHAPTHVSTVTSVKLLTLQVEGHFS